VTARAGALGLVVLLVACGSSPANPSVSRPAGTGGRGFCGPAGAKTLAADGRVRVYVLHEAVYGCSVALGRSFHLGHSTRSIREPRVGPVAVAGDLAAHGMQRFGVDTVQASVVVRRLTDGKVLEELPATRTVGAESFQSIGSVVVRASGAVAWIGSQTSIIGGRRGVTEVHADGAGGNRVLDAASTRPARPAGAIIEPASLRLHGTRLTWVLGTTTRHGILR
jgi:hypothetical protein